MSVNGYRDLLVWQKSMDLVTECYRLTRQFPDYERFSLSNQVQRAAVSVPANIAEGHSRSSTGAYLNHLSIANGSLSELETEILIAVRLQYLSESEAAKSVRDLEEVRRMLSGLIRSLKNRAES